MSAQETNVGNLKEPGDEVRRPITVNDAMPPPWATPERAFVRCVRR